MPRVRRHEIQVWLGARRFVPYSRFRDADDIVPTGGSPTHRDKAAMNGAQLYLFGKDSWMAGLVCGPPAEDPKEYFIIRLKVF